MDHDAMNENKEHTIGLVGEGMIYQQVKRQLKNSYRIIPLTPERSAQDIASCELVVCCNWL
jgi:ribosomal protein S12 methylthiotransferase accessory factor